MATRCNIFFLLLTIFQLVVSTTSEDDIIYENRIVGGLPALKGRYPYMVALLNGSSQFCGAALIAPMWVISAAHCGGYASHVMLGRNDLNNPLEPYERIPIDYEIRHPQYSRNSNRHDIMLVKLKYPSKATPVKYDGGGQRLIHGVDVTTMGWGTICHGGPQSSKLLEVTVDIVGNAICNNQYNGQISSDMMCASRAGKDACQGDSGGPLITKSNHFVNDTLVGIVSWGNGCAQPGYPGVYSRISNHIQWINSVVSETRSFTSSERARYNFFMVSKRAISSWNKERKKKNGLRNFS